MAVGVTSRQVCQISIGTVGERERRGRWHVVAWGPEVGQGGPEGSGPSSGVPSDRRPGGPARSRPRDGAAAIPPAWRRVPGCRCDKAPRTLRRPERPVVGPLGDARPWEEASTRHTKDLRAFPQFRAGAHGKQGGEWPDVARPATHLEPPPAGSRHPDRRPGRRKRVGGDKWERRACYRRPLDGMTGRNRPPLCLARSRGPAPSRSHAGMRRAHAVPVIARCPRDPPRAESRSRQGHDDFALHSAPRWGLADTSRVDPRGGARPVRRPKRSPSGPASPPTAHGGARTATLGSSRGRTYSDRPAARRRAAAKEAPTGT